jgi:hypothetical protein
MHKVFWIAKCEGKIPLGRYRRMWEIILECILEEQDGKVRTGFIWLGIGTSGGCCEHGNEP